MENKAHALAAGLFIALLGAAMLAVIAWFQDSTTGRVDYWVISGQGVPGLNLKAAVKLQGVPIGKVEAIQFDPDQPRRIRVRISVDSSAPITTATQARLGYQGITGLSFIDLSDKSDNAKRAEPGSEIVLLPSTLDQLSQSGPRLLAATQEAMQRASTLLGEDNQRQMMDSVNRLGEAAGEVAALARELRPLAQRLPALADQGQVLLREAGSSLKKVDAVSEEGLALGRELRQRAEALDRVGAAAAQLQQTSRNLEQALVGLDRPPRTQPLVDDLARAARALEQAAQGLADRPQGLIFGPRGAPPGPGESGFDARREPTR